MLGKTRHTGIQGRSSKDPVHQSGTHSYEQGSSTAKPSLKEDSCRVIGDDVDTTKLLHEHDKARSLSSASVPRDSEELQEEVATFLNVRLGFQESVRVEHITSSLERCGPETQHGGMGIDVTTLTDVLEANDEHSDSH